MKKYLSRLLSALLALVLLTAPASALTVDQALELLEDTYYYGIPEEAYEAESLEELLKLLGDPYTQYLTPAQYQAFFESVDGEEEAVGIGILSYFTEEGILINEAVSGGSAQAAGLRAGDLIVAVDGISCVPALEEHRQLMLGEEGTQVTVTVLRDGVTRDYTLTRRAVRIANVRITLLDGGVGYIHCDSFSSDAGELFSDILKRYDSQVNCWIVDLRNNGGGYVDSAADMLAALCGPDRYIYFEDSDGQVGYYARTTKAASEKPVLLLVNSYSASASEAMASGVRDTDRGVIIGSRSYGKGVGQTILDESTNPEYFNGDGLKVTIGRFYSVGGTTTDMIGVIPTLLVDDASAAAVAAALCGGSEDTSSLCLLVGSQPFYVDPDADSQTLSALLAAISPRMTLFYNSVAFSDVTPAQAAAALGLSYDNRWFNDVSDSLYANSINALGTYKLLSGTGGGQFNPKGQLTRAQLCMILARILNVSSSGPSRFSDVAQNAWYGPAVNAMAELGLVTGVGGGRFDPNSPVTQEQFLTILGRTARYLNFALDAYGELVDNPRTDLPLDMEIGLAPYAKWAKSGVAVLAWGLEDALDGYGDMLYTSLEDITPSAPILREEAAAGIYALLSGLEILP
ncbi:MAG: S-layer homology domain-containing protein [Oscillospiraceae bacterium]|nr:S-layer homology domain-containing protein [Oscillospiraceae bacterium]